MRKKELTAIRDTVDSEGFDYTFMQYSDFAEIRDEEFHRRRVAYREAAKALATYLGIED